MLPSSTSSNSLSTKNVQSISTSENQYTSSSNNKRLITWLAVSIIGCLGGSSLLGYLYLRKRRSSDYSKASSLESQTVDSTATFELKPTIKRHHKEIGGEYFQLSKIDKFEAEDIYKQTGYLIVIPEDKRGIKHVVGKGHFGAIKVAQRKADNEYVASKKVKGKDNMRVSEQEAQMQREAAGKNILPIYHTVTLEDALFHFMPLAGYGSGETVQKQLSSIKNPNLVAEIIKFIAKDVLTGLKTIHNKEISHLDLKPDNIVFREDGTAYITDFGCAKKSADSKISGKELGDIRYFSPERFAAKKEGKMFDSQKADIWAAGLMLLGIYKNQSPIELLKMSRDLSKRITESSEGFFQEKLDQIEELKTPKEGTIWWVIKGLLDPNEKTRLTVNKALEAPCFKGLSKDIRFKLFQDIRVQNLIENTDTDKKIDMGNYGFVNLLAVLREEGRISEMQELIEDYEISQERVTPEMVRSGKNQDYRFSPEFS